MKFDALNAALIPVLGRIKEWIQENPKLTRVLFVVAGVKIYCKNYCKTILQIDCQPYGCEECEAGYYKMGSLNRCQSCNDVNLHCIECEDINGCVKCDTGYSLSYNTECQQETCNLVET